MFALAGSVVVPQPFVIPIARGPYSKNAPNLESSFAAARNGFASQQGACGLEVVWSAH